MNTHAAENYYASVLSRHERSMIEVIRRITERFTYQGRPLCRVLQPFFVDPSTYEAAMAAAALLVRGLHAVVQEPAAGVSRELSANARRRELLADAIAKGAFLGGRVDMLITSSGPQVLEFNATSPDRMAAGVDFSDPLASCFADSDVMREFSQEFPSRYISLYERLFDSFVSKHERRGGTGIPTVAEIRVPARDTGRHEPVPEALEAEMLNLFGYLHGRGLGVQMCELSDVRYDGEVLSANGTRIDVAFIAGDSEYLDFCAPDDPLWRALRDGAVSTACGYPLGNLFFDKSLMADLTDPVVTRALDPELAEGISKIVPWTRRVGDAKTTFHGAPIDLLDFIRSNREILVLKPSSRLGGEGLALGWETSQEEWVEKLATLPGDYIVQERVVGEKIHLPYLDGGKIAREELYFDFNPYVWNDGRAAGALVRVSRSAVLNFTQGTGSVAPVFVLDPGH
jgi:hypothetical protein